MRRGAASALGSPQRVGREEPQERSFGPADRSERSMSPSPSRFEREQIKQEDLLKGLSLLSSTRLGTSHGKQGSAEEAHSEEVCEPSFPPQLHPQLILQEDNHGDLVEQTAPHQPVTEVRPPPPLTREGGNRATLTLGRDLDRPSDVQPEAELETEPKLPWVKAERGGAVQGHTTDRQGFTPYLNMGAKGRQIGATTPLVEPPPVGRRLTYSGTDETANLPSRDADGYKKASPQVPPGEQMKLLLELVSQLRQEQAHMKAAHEKELEEVHAHLLHTQAAERKLAARLDETEKKAQATERELTAHLDETERKALQRERVLTLRVEQIQGELGRVMAALETEQISNKKAQQQIRDMEEQQEGVEGCVANMQEQLRQLAHEVPDLQQTKREVTTLLGQLFPPSHASTPHDPVQDTGGSSKWSMEAAADSNQDGSQFCTNTGGPPINQGEEEAPPGRGPSVPPMGPQLSSLGQTQTAVSTGRTKKNKVHTQLPRFRGKHQESISAFLQKMESLAKMGDWDEAFHAQMIFLNLDDPACQYVQGLPEETRCNLQKLRAALTERYAGDLMRREIKESLKSVRRQRGESLQELGQRIRHLVRTAWPSDPGRQEEAALDTFKTAVSEKYQEQMVMAALTMDAAIHRFSMVEMGADTRNRMRQGPGRVNQVAEPHTTVKEGQEPREAPVRAIAEPRKEELELLKQLVKEVASLRQERPQQAPVRPPLARGPMEGRPRDNKIPRWRGPSKDHPCAICKSPDHWVKDCPKQEGSGSKKESPQRTGGNRQGPVPGSENRS